MSNEHRIRALQRQERRALTPEARRKAGEELDQLLKAQRRQRGGR